MQNETIERIPLGHALVSPIGGYRGVLVFQELRRGSSEQNEHAKDAFPERNAFVMKAPVRTHIARTPIARIHH